jgi:hypothetical protein
VTYFAEIDPAEVARSFLSRPLVETARLFPALAGFMQIYYSDPPFFAAMMRRWGVPIEEDAT